MRITDAAGKVLGERAFEHGGAGLSEMADWLLSFAAGVAEGRAETAGGGEPVASTATLPDASEPAGAPAAEGYGLFLAPPTADDERGEQEAEVVEAEEEAQIEAITEAAESGPAAVPGAERAAPWQREQRLLDRMQAIAERARHLPDAKTRRLLDWIRRADVPGPAVLRQPARRSAAALERAPRPHLHREPRGDEAPSGAPSWSRPSRGPTARASASR